MTNIVLRTATVLHPNFNGKFQARATDYIVVPMMSTRGSWPAVHMIDEDTFVRMAILAGHVKAPTTKRLGTNRKGFRPA